MKPFKNKKNKNDLIISMVLKDSFSMIGYFFVNVINESLMNAKIPDMWKITTIVPIPKIKNTNECSEYRPINVLPVHAKLLECTVKCQLLKYIEDNQILTKRQSGFRSNHSCETSLNFVIAGWK